MAPRQDAAPTGFACVMGKRFSGCKLVDFESFGEVRWAQPTLRAFSFSQLTIPSFQHSIIPGGKRNVEAKNNNKFNAL
jgi:hypothetical protein